MLEVEITNYNLKKIISLIIKLLKTLINSVLVNCAAELKLLSKANNQDLELKLKNFLENEFIIISYSKAINIINNHMQQTKIQ